MATVNLLKYGLVVRLVLRAGLKEKEADDVQVDR